jgi:metallo-beta-lactamase family protein
VELTFLGGAGTVTGSRTLVTAAGRRILVDCGLFQGLKQLRLRNRAPFPIPPAEIDAVVLTHAHIDHTGYLPLLVRNGFSGPVYCTPATADLCRLLLLDSGYLQEEEAARANRYGYSKHTPALPLYTKLDAERALHHLVPVPFDADHTASPADEVSFRYRRAGHILGAASVTLTAEGTNIAFSGDVGRYGDPLLPDPEPVPAADFVVLESTYGGRRHDDADPAEVLADVISRTAARGGTVVIPAFAVGRAQSLLYYLHRLRLQEAIPALPLFIDSPMAGSATDLMTTHAADHRLSRREWADVLGSVTITASVEESKQISRRPGPKVIISASGMATGGRVLHHLAHYATNARNTILFAGYQAPGTRGAIMLSGAHHIRIHGADVPVRAEVAVVHGLSAHADADELMRWLGGFERPPSGVFLNHGEAAAADALRFRIVKELGWPVHVPEHNEHVALARAMEGAIGVTT